MYRDRLLLTSPLTPTHRTYHTLGGPIALSENGVGKHIGRDWWRNEDAGVFYPPPTSSFAPQHPKRSSKNPTAVFVVPTPRPHSHHNTQTKQREFHRCLRRSHTPSLFAPQHTDEDGDNPTAVFIVPTYSRKRVTLAVQSSVIPTAAPLPTTAAFEANTPRRHTQRPHHRPYALPILSYSHHPATRAGRYHCLFCP